MLSSVGPLEISLLDSANMDWLLHFQKSQSSPDAPWLLNQHSQGSRGEAVICISHGASRPRRCRGRQSECHMSLPSAMQVNKWIGGEFFGGLTRAVIISSRSSCSRSFSIFHSLLFFLPLSPLFRRFSRGLDLAWLQALISGSSESEVYWSSLWSAEWM